MLGCSGGMLPQEKLQSVVAGRTEYFMDSGGLLIDKLRIIYFIFHAGGGDFQRILGLFCTSHFSHVECNSNNR